ncbi:transglutaminase [Altererythrobacter sp. B11]|uniref:transglutaminase-like cysteine peptidase n=1 Tax=Altererythrobacter sp. B11 TaxID=2060312 RepID=UPI000DC73EE1|nr:transglutaminase-like cysteine peptidase [Altererythrobacter sp. B11]BBC70945.1 transglutaminase [Altererythrobacter sp. B11]
MLNRVIALAAGVALGLSATPALASQQPAFIPFGETADAPAGFLEMCVRDAAQCAAPGSPALPPHRAPDQLVPPPMILAGCVDEFFAGAGAEASPYTCTAGATPQYFRSASLVVPATATPADLDFSPPRAEPDSRQLPKLVREINQRVNRSVRQRSDLQLFGVDEYWQPAGLGADAFGDCEDIALQKRVQLLQEGFAPERLFLAVVFRSGVGLHTVLVARLDDGDVVLDSATGIVWPWQDTPYSWLRVQSPDQPMQWYRVAAG